MNGRKYIILALASMMQLTHQLYDDITKLKSSRKIDKAYKIGAFRSTSTTAVKLLIDIPPLKLVVKNKDNGFKWNTVLRIPIIHDRQALLYLL